MQAIWIYTGEPYRSFMSTSLNDGEETLGRSREVILFVQGLNGGQKIVDVADQGGVRGGRALYQGSVQMLRK